MKINIIILNYNGRDLLDECLPSIVDAAAFSSYQTKVTVLDNCSTDDSVEYVRENFPGVDIVSARENRVLCSYNEILNDINDDVVVLLNNDIKVDKDFINPLAGIFEKDKDVFLVSSRSYFFDGQYEGGRSHGFIKWGIFGAANSFREGDTAIDKANFTFSAGFGAFDRKKFLELGGYDELYLPGRLEDADICFRAWKRGWKCVYEPRSIVYHKGAVSFNRSFGVNGTLVINFRNTFLFMWKNITDFGYLVPHVVFLMPRLVFSAIKGKPELFLGFFKALPLMGKALKKRRIKEPFVRSDRDVFDLFDINVQRNNRVDSGVKI